MTEYEKAAAKALEAQLAAYEREVQRMLAKALVEMRGKMAALYDKWAVDGNLSKADMTKYNRYATMERQMMAALDPALTESKEALKHLPPEAYNEAFFRYAWTVDSTTKLRIAYGVINKRTLSALFNITNPDNAVFRKALKNYGDEAKKWIREALLKGMAQGKGYATMVRDLKEALGKTAYQALRILRTEGQRAQILGQQALYDRAREAGVNGEEIWDATLDKDTRPSHAELDQTPRGPDGKFNVGGHPAEYPMDSSLPPEESIQCRCRLTLRVDGYEPALRRTREEGVIPYQNYKQWAAEYHPDYYADKFGG